MNKITMSKGVKEITMCLNEYEPGVSRMELFITPADRDIGNLTRDDWVIITSMLRTTEFTILGKDSLTLMPSGDGRVMYTFTSNRSGAFVVGWANLDKREVELLDTRLVIGTLRIPFKRRGD